MPVLSIMAALDRDRLIGRGGALPWRLPDDLKRFKQLTMGRPIVMGRRTWESIGRALPGRRNIVLSRSPAFQAEGCEVYPSLLDAIRACADAEEVIVIGGSSLYEEALPLADRLYLTEVDAGLKGDTWFPEFDRENWIESSRDPHPPDDHHPHPFTFITLERKKEVNPTAPRP